MRHRRTPFAAILFVIASTTHLAGCLSVSNVGGVNKTVVVPGTENRKDSVTVIAGPEYAAGGLHTTFFGEHYRTLWNTPIRIPVIDLATFAGGLTPIKTGGGFQTKSLRFKGSDGRQYAFRSVNKDPKKVLPEDLRETVAADIFQDQISSSHPAGAAVVDVLADAVGVLHAHPVLCMLPDDERLGEFRAAFSGIIGVLEEHPDDGPDGTPGFAGSKKIVKTDKLFVALDNNSEDRVNARAFLAARLLDVFVGDWDRHVDQWLWARFKEEGRDIFYPIPRDRDQAFARFDGLLPWMAVRAVDQFESFYDDFHSVYGLTFSGRFLDHRILVDLSRPVWDSVATSVMDRLTDAVIDSAVKRLPPPYYDLNAAWLAQSLKSRRTHLKEASDKYYSLIAGYVDIRLSDKPEFVEISRLDDETVEVTAWKKNKQTNGTKGDPLYHRVFSHDETSEIRIYLLGGDDRAVVNGDVNTSITVRVIGGKGDDELVDSSIVHGVLLGFIPFIPQADHKTYFYDSSGDNTFVDGPSCSVDKRKE